jgi:hypothetical protein
MPSINQSRCRGLLETIQLWWVGWGGGLVNEDAPAGPGALAGKPPRSPPLERHHSCLLAHHPPPQFTRLPRQLAPLFFLISPFSFSPSDDCFPRKLYPRCSATSTELPPTTSTQASGRKEKKTVAMAQHEILTHFRGYGFGLTDNRAAHVGH